MQILIVKRKGSAFTRSLPDSAKKFAKEVNQKGDFSSANLEAKSIHNEFHKDDSLVTPVGLRDVNPVNLYTALAGGSGCPVHMDFQGQDDAASHCVSLLATADSSGIGRVSALGRKQGAFMAACCSSCPKPYRRAA